MRAALLVLAAVTSATATAIPAAAAAAAARQTSEYAGYLISTFTDADPRVQWHLSDGNSAASFSFLNGGSPVLGSTVGTTGVRDIYLATNSARSEFYLIATGKCCFFSSFFFFLFQGSIR